MGDPLEDALQQRAAEAISSWVEQARVDSQRITAAAALYSDRAATLTALVTGALRDCGKEYRLADHVLALAEGYVQQLRALEYATHTLSALMDDSPNRDNVIRQIVRIMTTTATASSRV